MTLQKTIRIRIEQVAAFQKLVEGSCWPSATIRQTLKTRRRCEEHVAAKVNFKELHTIAELWL